MPDVNIKIIDRNGEEHTVEAPTDMNMNLMEVVKAYELAEEGTFGICGGMALCASCQCYVLNDTPLPEMEDAEDAMLSDANFVKENSRLSCQLFVNEQMEGLEIQLAPAE